MDVQLLDRLCLDAFDLRVQEELQRNALYVHIFTELLM